MNFCRLVMIILITVLSSTLSYGQDDQQQETKTTVKPMQLSGPRLGITFLSGKFVDNIKEKHDIDLNPTIFQFGWQTETRFFTVKSGATAVSEWVMLVGGFEQEKFIPSLTWIIGMRTAEGFEFGAGPNLALSGTSVVLAAGITLQSEEINFPINLAYSTAASGSRVSLLFGFNIRDPE